MFWLYSAARKFKNAAGCSCQRDTREYVSQCSCRCAFIDCPIEIGQYELQFSDISPVRVPTREPSQFLVQFLSFVLVSHGRHD